MVALVVPASIVNCGWNVIEHEMWIFDRWGNNIWYTQQWGNKWDGRANGGKKIVQEDVYIWKIIVYDFLGKKHSYIGHVSVIK